jgi:hypothetical protein
LATFLSEAKFANLGGEARVHPSLWAAHYRNIHCMADHGSEADGREAESHLNLGSA